MGICSGGTFGGPPIVVFSDGRLVVVLADVEELVVVLDVLLVVLVVAVVDLDVLVVDLDVEVDVVVVVKMKCAVSARFDLNAPLMLADLLVVPPMQTGLVHVQFLNV